MAAPPFGHTTVMRPPPDGAGISALAERWRRIQGMTPADVHVWLDGHVFVASLCPNGNIKVVVRPRALIG